MSLDQKLSQHINKNSGLSRFKVSLIFLVVIFLGCFLSQIAFADSSPPAVASSLDPSSGNDPWAIFQLMIAVGLEIWYVIKIVLLISGIIGLIFIILGLLKIRASALDTQSGGSHLKHGIILVILGGLLFGAPTLMEISGYSLFGSAPVPVATNGDVNCQMVNGAYANGSCGIPCPSGQQADSSGGCTACPSGQGSSAGGTCQTCAAGQIVSGGECITCDSGSVVSNGVCIPCSGGSTPQNGACTCPDNGTFINSQCYASAYDFSGSSCTNFPATSQPNYGLICHCQAPNGAGGVIVYQETTTTPVDYLQVTASSRVAYFLSGSKGAVTCDSGTPAGGITWPPTSS